LTGRVALGYFRRSEWLKNILNDFKIHLNRLYKKWQIIATNPHVNDEDIIARMRNNIINRVNTMNKVVGVMTLVSTNFFI
jgi:hypothetical protein